MRWWGVGLSVFAVFSASCALPGRATTGMTLEPSRVHPEEPSLDELARVQPERDHRALLVAYPTTACSGSARVVFLDEKGAFLGAVAPGDAALLDVPARTHRLLAFSSVDVTAPVGVWFLVDHIDVPPAPSGILLTSYRPNTRTCGSGHYADARIATKSELEDAIADASEIRWLSPRPAEGQAWLDENRARVDELLGRTRAKRPSVVTRRGP